jgi:hypothetical protein
MKRQCETVDGRAVETASEPSPFELLDEAVICIIMEFLVRSTAISDWDRAKDLLAMSRTCRKLRLAAQSQTARVGVWPLLDPANILAARGIRRPGMTVAAPLCNLRTFFGGIPFCSARSIASDGGSVVAIIRLAMLSAPTIASIRIGPAPISHLDDRGDLDATPMHPAIRDALALPALRDLEIDRHQGYDDIWHGNARPCPELRRLVLGGVGADVFIPGAFPKLRTLKLGTVFLRCVTRAIACCPLLEKLGLSAITYDPLTYPDGTADRDMQFVTSPVCLAELGSAAATAVHLRTISVESCRNVAWVPALLRNAPVGLVSLRVHGDGGSGWGPVLTGRFEALEKLELISVPLRPEDIRAFSVRHRRLLTLVLGPLGSELGPALVQFGNEPGARQLDKLRLVDARFDVSGFIATPRCSALRSLALVAHQDDHPLVVPPQLKETLREFICGCSYPHWIIGPVLRSCPRIERLNILMPTAVDSVHPCWWIDSVISPIVLTVATADGTELLSLVAVLGNRIRELTMVCNYEASKLIDPDAIAKENPTIGILILVVHNRFKTKCWVSPNGGHPLITVLPR